MMRVKKVAILSCLIGLLLTMTSCKNGSPADLKAESEEPSSMKVDFLYTFDYWNLYDWSQSYYPTKDDYEEAVTNYLNLIASYLGKEDWINQYDPKYKTLYINLEVNSSIQGAQIIWPTQYTSDSLVCKLRLSSNNMTGEITHNPICHELTHLITYQPNLQAASLSYSLNDGLCEYISNSVGEPNDCFLFDIDSHTYLLLYFQELLKEGYEEQVVLDDVIDSIGNLEYSAYHYSAFSKEWMYSYIYNYSFVSYLIDTYGLEYFLSLHDPYKDSSLMEEHQDKLQELKEEWLVFLDHNVCTMSFSEMMEFLDTNR